MREHLAFVELDPVVDDAAHRVAGRRERPADVQEVVAEIRKPTPHLLGGPVLDVILELVDLVVERVDQVEERLGDVVDEVVRVLADRLVGPAGGQRGLDVERLLARRRLPHRQ